MSKIEYFHAEGGASNPAPLSPAVRAGDFIYVSGQVPTLAGGSVVAHDVETQTAQVMRNIEEALKLAGCELSDICKTTVWLHDARDFTAELAVDDRSPWDKGELVRFLDDGELAAG